MLSITAVLGPDEFRLCICLGDKGGSQIRTGTEDVEVGSSVLLTLSKCLEIELASSEAKNATLKGDYLR
jgi:hypothetical protein